MEGKWEVFVKELKMVSFLSAPMVAVSVLQYSLPFVTLMMVGQLDELSLSGVSVAFSFTIVTGYSLILGSSAAALASASSYLLDVLMLGVYMKYSSACEKARAVFSKDVFFSMREFFHFAVPSAGMVW
ncbi:hypothetical protein SO802_024815 [Lithocarpus litseifolius]|uniref:Uncharacterized protein n=1 Tax=Lithocarpus litseifolius TaxID=425828 RepID=A0AAW2CAP1_9ROSI